MEGVKEAPYRLCVSPLRTGGEEEVRELDGAEPGVAGEEEGEGMTTTDWFLAFMLVLCIYWGCENLIDRWRKK